MCDDSKVPPHRTIRKGKKFSAPKPENETKHGDGEQIYLRHLFKKSLQGFLEQFGPQFDRL